MNTNTRRVQAIFRKELREYQRNGSIVSTMAVIPLIFVIQPLIQVFALPLRRSRRTRVRNTRSNVSAARSSARPRSPVR